MGKRMVAVFMEFFYGPSLYLLSHREKFSIAPPPPPKTLKEKSCPPKNRHSPLYINYEPSLSEQLL